MAMLLQYAKPWHSAPSCDHEIERPKTSFDVSLESLLRSIECEAPGTCASLRLYCRPANRGSVSFSIGGSGVELVSYMRLSTVVDQSDN